jgi:peptidyl-prolyl cis-trans isomerase SurA
MKKLALSFFSLSIVLISYAQPVFTYGGKPVSKEEFLRAFNKNPNPAANRKQALKEYLDLYINYKLKVQAAYDEKLQNDPAQLVELENFKNQVAENILNDEARIDELVKEAFKRSQKDIYLQQVFVEITAGGDTAAAFQKIQLAYKALKEGKDFGLVTKEFNNGSSGDLGYITVFTLPYQFENAAFSLKPGTISAPFKSNLGYHIFKNLKERKAAGTVKLSQILIAVPPSPSPEQLQNAHKLADSVYTLVKEGTSFETMVRTFSNNGNTSSGDGQLPEVGVGQYSAAFEEAAFALNETNQISKPILTEFGYHILKLKEKKPVVEDLNSAVSQGELKDKVTKDVRMTNAKRAMAAKQLMLIKYKQAVYNSNDLWRYTDSALKNSKPAPVAQVNDKTILFSFAKQKIIVEDWIKFARATRASSSAMSALPYNDLMKGYVTITAGEYYKQHLSEYSHAFTQQVQEFKEANMLFGIMDTKVWSMANTDTAGLHDYYKKHQAKYQWGPSADALIIVSSNQKVAEEVKQKINPDFSNWHSVVEAYNGTLTADSGRYELGQLPVIERTNFTPGIVTAPVKNEADGTFTFNYIIKVYRDNEQRNFDDARGMVISDYQQVLEDKWLAQLKKKYPVKINTAVIK